MKIGIMGGTFNPVHNGHLALAKAAKEQYRLDVVWFMPSGLPAHKSNSELTDGVHRLRMVELALAGQEGFLPSDFELAREGYTYTANTLTKLKEIYPEDEFYFIIGGDSLMKFLSWKRPDVIAEKAVLLAAGRNGFTENELFCQIERLKQELGARAYLVDMEEIPVSSRQIREYCQKEQYDKVSSYVPAQVLSYIKEHHLFL